MARHHRRRNRHERMLIRRKIIFYTFLCIILLAGIWIFYLWFRNRQEKPTQVVLPSDVATRTEASTPFDPSSARKEHIRKVIEQADYIAAGYDYDAAIKLLEADSYYRETLEMLELVEQLKKDKAKLKAWCKPEEVTVLAFNPLIVDPNRALNMNAHAAEYNKNNITIKEFERILQSLYENNYILVRMTDLVSFEQVLDDNGQPAIKRTKNTLLLPENKKPIILTQNNVNYYASYAGNGFADRLVLTVDNRVLTEYRDIDGTVQIGEYDFIPVLNSFVQKHPDFSYRGAKGVLGMTGYEGAFGYRIQNEDADNYSFLINAVISIANNLKENGWEFACAGFAGQKASVISVEEFSNDYSKWKTMYAPILGDVVIYMWPYGEDSGNEIGSWRSYAGLKYETLRDNGISYYLNIDAANPSWVQITGRYLRMGRIDITGSRLYDEIYKGKNKLSFLFDANKIYASTERPQMK